MDIALLAVMSEVATVPVNYRAQAVSREAIARDVDYAMQVGLNYARAIGAALASSNSGLSVVDGFDLVEIGPGPSLGPALLLACGGARVTVADRFAARWDPQYHPVVLRELLQRVDALQPGLGAPIARVIEARAFVPEVIDLRECAAEELDRLPAGSADLVISNAVLEHLADVPRAFRGMAHISRPGSLGLHQVDFRDHRDFSKPLGYMTLSAPDFQRLFDSQMGECGNRWRSGPMRKAFESAGFEVRRFDPSLWAEPAYLADIKTRLHPDVQPVSDLDLSVTSGHYVVQRRA